MQNVFQISYLNIIIRCAKDLNALNVFIALLWLQDVPTLNMYNTIFDSDNNTSHLQIQHIPTLGRAITTLDPYNKDEKCAFR